MQSLIVGLLLAGVSAISFVAFKYPNGYARLFPYMMGVVTALFLGVTVWQAAVEASWTSANVFLARESQSDAQTAKDRLSVPYLSAVFAYLGAAAFLWINLRLPAFLEHTDDDIEASENGGH